MNRTLTTLALSVAAICISSNSTAQQSAASDEAAPVVAVSSVKNPQLKPYRQMLKGLDAYADHRALAPAARLQFALVADGAKVKLDDVTLRLAGDHASIPVPVSPDGIFVLEKIQSAVDDNADMVSNKKKDALHWHADIHTPDVPASARRLGDLRLECEISWAVIKDDMNFFMRNGVMLAGGLCHSSHIMLHYSAPRALAAVTLVSGERRAALTIDKKDRRVFMPPLSDSSWNDDALIEYQFADAVASPASASARATPN